MNTPQEPELEGGEGEKQVHEIEANQNTSATDETAPPLPQSPQNTTEAMEEKSESTTDVESENTADKDGQKDPTDEISQSANSIQSSFVSLKMMISSLTSELEQLKVSTNFKLLVLLPDRFFFFFLRLRMHQIKQS